MDRSRRTFIHSAGALIGAVSAGCVLGEAAGNTVSDKAQRTYHVLGVPLRSGSLYPGTEDDARAWRDAGLIARLQKAGCNVVDDGNVAVPSYLPHHSIPPIRNWPGPRVVWDLITERVGPYLKGSMQVPLLIGCDCSVVIGTAQALVQDALTDVHVLYLDGDFDDAPPEAEHSQSAASLAVWLLTHTSPFWAGPPLQPSQVTVIGSSNPSRSDNGQLRKLLLNEVRRLGPAKAARQVLDAIPRSAQLLLHLDIDVFRKDQLPVAYFPHTEGLTLSEGAQLLGVLARDPRIRIVEISEYASLRDPDLRWAGKLVDMLGHVLKP